MLSPVLENLVAMLKGRPCSRLDPVCIHRTLTDVCV